MSPIWLDIRYEKGLTPPVPTHPGCIAALEAAPKLNPVVVEDAGAAPKLKPFALESSALAAPEPKEKVDGDEVV